jgi:hypothetical protein
LRSLVYWKGVAVAFKRRTTPDKDNTRKRQLFNLMISEIL